MWQLDALLRQINLFIVWDLVRETETKIIYQSTKKRFNESALH